MSDCHRCGFLSIRISLVGQIWRVGQACPKMAWLTCSFLPDQYWSMMINVYRWLLGPVTKRVKLDLVNWLIIKYFGEYMGDRGKDYPAQNMGIQDKPSARCGDLWCVLMVQAASCVQKTDECNKKSSPLPTVRRDWRCSSAGELICDKLRLGWTKVNFMIWGKQLEQLECVPRIPQGYPNVAGLICYI